MWLFSRFIRLQLEASAFFVQDSQEATVAKSMAGKTFRGFYLPFCLPSICFAKVFLFAIEKKNRSSSWRREEAQSGCFIRQTWSVTASRVLVRISIPV